MKYYYLIVEVTHYYTGWGCVDFHKPPSVETEREEHVTNVLPALYILDLERKAIESRLYDPTRGRDGGCYNVTYSLQMMQEITCEQAASLNEARELVEKQRVEYEQRLREEKRLGKQDKEENFFFKLWDSIFKHG